MATRKQPTGLPPTLGPIVCDWMETFLVHGPGDVRGEPYRLNDDQRLHIYRAYEQVKINGVWRRRFMRSFYSRRKGAAKSEMDAALAAVELCGPVRCDGLDANGNAVGRPVKTPVIPILATAEVQAMETVYGSFMLMVGEGRAVDEYQLDIGMQRTFLGNHGQVRLSTSAPSSADGGRTTFVVADETHLWTTPQLRELFQVTLRNIGKMLAGDPWIEETTTMFRPGQDSVAEASFEYGMQVQSGQIKDPTFLFDCLSADESHDIHTKSGLRAAIKQASGKAWSFTNVRAIEAQFADPQQDEADNRRYWLNQVWKGADAWVDLEAWDANERPGQSIPEGAFVTLGFDGSDKHDSTALVATEVVTGHQQMIAIWERPEDVKDWSVPRDEVDQAVRDAVEKFRVVRFYLDPPWWRDELIRWANEFPDIGVTSWETGRLKEMAAALEDFHTSIMHGRVTHDGNRTYRRHIGNAKVKFSRHLLLIEKDRPKSPRKIDAAIAGTLSWRARQDAIANGFEPTPVVNLATQVF